MVKKSMSKKYFRWHRGGYAESMGTMIEVGGVSEIQAIIKKAFPDGYLSNIKISSKTKRPHRDPNDNWGADTFMVVADFDGYKEQCLGYSNFEK